MKQLLKNLFFWLLDYIYVLRKEMSSVISTSRPEQYRTKDGHPIILIPGIYENWRFMQPIARMLHAHGYDVHIIDGLGFNRGTIEDMAEVISTYIVKQQLSSVIIIAHSKGGLIGKYLLSTEQNPNTIDGLIALNTPFSGSRYAYILPFKSLRIFVPNSKILLTLAKNKIINSQIVSIYGMFDPHIPGGSKLAGAKNIKLNTYGHFRIMGSQLVHRAILESIKSLSV